MLGRRPRATVCLLGLLVLVGGVSWGDEWPAPQIREAWSLSRDYFIRMAPGKGVGDTVGFRGSATGPAATAELYRRARDRSYHPAWTITPPNPVAPIDLFVTDRGYLATLDNWHNMGCGTVVAFYSPTGTPIRAYTLADLFSTAEIEAMPKSVSSIWWRKPGAYVRPDQQTLYVRVDEAGRELVFETETGAYQYCEPRAGTRQCRSTNEGRQWRGYVDPGLRP
ncbi:MAG TPA: hypothetical protein VL086_01145 [Candidatus Nitrosotalea sp.]|nr:hypothetical protein [Candidatus Nitrosotalea sp.]